MKRMRAFDLGKMRHRISLYTPTPVDDSAGGYDRSDPSVPTKVGDFWGYMEPVTPAERQWGEQFTEVTSHVCWLRYNTAVVPGMVIQRDGGSYYVESVIDPNLRKEFLFLTLREGGPL